MTPELRHVLRAAILETVRAEPDITHAAVDNLIAAEVENILDAMAQDGAVAVDPSGTLHAADDEDRCTDCGRWIDDHDHRDGCGRCDDAPHGVTALAGPCANHHRGCKRRATTFMRAPGQQRVVAGAWCHRCAERARDEYREELGQEWTLHMTPSLI